ncbi:MAG: D-(-)-3-hydroxybutyrate oligomer hydrolase [Polaromonas sp.]|uniref:3-hydroxybutyrate oligomer hydrolase family protein n=1 Tax=Polaromonas sp. TaxID=1869339 RepID=UPI0017E7412C|nr:3-hydroxybutyrate oligomer hydrolase family protein [Polaromonas sp.]NMM08753.1 D-(-)-3-hydroxybutyrate oligomer hydrolase [Polaromonas sp.]
MNLYLSQMLALFLVAGVSGCGDSGSGNPGLADNIKPSFIKTSINKTVYDGTSNDLLSGGLGKSGLQAAAPAFADPANPTAAELRTRAIYNNYRALLDMNPNGGYGVLYGPNVNAAGVAGTGEGRIAGEEHVTYADDGTGKLNVTLMVQIPATFNTAAPCIVTAVSSGSRGIYGAIGTSGEWGLKNGCAVAFADKGTGNGAHDLQNNQVNLIDGRVVSAATAGTASQFTSGLSATQLAAFNTATPNRFAFKQAHSQQNPEKDWGLNTLQAVQFAFYVLNEKFGPSKGDGSKQQSLLPGNTIVIASSVSNGAGAALAAAEQDTGGLISGIAIAEPQVQVTPNAALTIRRGSTVVASSGKGLLDMVTIANLYQPCAALAASVAASPGLGFVNATRAQNRCAGLAAKGLLTSTTPAAQADESLAKLRASGWEPESDLFHASHYALAVPAVAVTYSNSYAKASVADNLCGLSFGATTAVTGVPAALATTSAVQLFASGNGIPPTGSVNIINNNSVGGPLLDGQSTSPSTGAQDLNIDAALCLRNLLTGTDAKSTMVQTSISQVRRTSNLRGKPAIIVHGRSDTLEPVNHTSRPYYGNNQLAEGSASKLHYYEVTNAQHFDGFIDNIALPGYDTRLVPLHIYLVRALDLMLANLRSGTPLPPSQVVRTVPRGGTSGSAPPITAANVPNIAATPGSSDAITFAGGVLTIPD